MHRQLLLLICTFAVGALGHTNIRLDPDFNVMFHMTSFPNRIEIQVIAKTTGWVGFGFSHSGSMTNADMVIGGLNGTNNESIYYGDYWSVNSDTLPIYDNQQNWYINETLCVQNDTHTTMYYYRQLDTLDTAQDLVIPDDHIYLVWSYGASDTLDVATRREVYQERINLVGSGSHGGSSVIHGSVATILMCVGLYVFH